MKKLNIVVLSGAGLSAESGIATFRDKDGLWEGHDVMSVASPEGWKRDQALVLDFYNQRRKQLKAVSPNAGHFYFSELQERFEVIHITQNVDDLLERAGNKKVIHLHGELRKVRSTAFEELVYEWTEDLNRGDLCERGHQLRPHIVWFGEEVPMLEVAAQYVQSADMIIVVGTSMQVYPAASLVGFAAPHVPCVYIDPNPTLNYELNQRSNLKIIKNKVTKALDQISFELKKL